MKESRTAQWKQMKESYTPEQKEQWKKMKESRTAQWKQMKEDCYNSKQKEEWANMKEQWGKKKGEWGCWGKKLGPNFTMPVIGPTLTMPIIGHGWGPCPFKKNQEQEEKPEKK